MTPLITFYDKLSILNHNKNMKKKKLRNYLYLLIPLFILIIISLINMKIAGNHQSIYKNYFLKQSIWFSCGLLILLIMKFIKPKFLFKYSFLFYLLNIILLILVLFFGKSINGSKAWFDFHFFSFQPSELMKFTLALYLSQKASSMPNGSFKKEFKFILTTLFITLIPSLLVFLEPDTGAIIIYFLILLGIIFIYRLKFKWYIIIFIILSIILANFFYLYYFNKDLLIKLIGTSFFYRVDRLLTFVSGDSFQLDRALISIGSSTFFSNNNYLYIPEAPTDFIIAFSINNFGIFGFLIILLCYFILDIYFFYKLLKLKNKKAKMFLSAFLIMFLFAQIENIGMNLGLLPIIGLPLPFLSYGGTNTIVYFLFLGIIINLNDQKTYNYL